MKKIIDILMFSVFTALFAANAQANELLFYKDVYSANDQGNEAAALTLDSEMYLNTNNSLSDIRIYNAQAEEVPYVLRKLRGREKVISENIVNMKTLDLKELPENKLSIIMEKDNRNNNKAKAQEEIFPNELTIRTSNSNFEKTVSVFGSNDKQTWEMLCEDQLIFDYSRFIDLRNTSVSFKDKPFKYYKVVINDVSQALVSSFSQIFTKYAKGKVNQEYASFIRYEGTLHINKLEFRSKKEKDIYGEKKMIPYSLDINKVEVNDKDKTSDIYLISRKEPLTKLLFETKDKNFKRRVDVEANKALGGDKPKWSRIAASTIYDISAGEFKKEKLDIDLPRYDSRYERYRVRIFNNDNAPIKVNSVKAEGSVHEIIFFHKGQENLRVYYGKDDVKQPYYDVSSILEEMPLVEAGRWQIGRQEINKNASSKKERIISSKNLLVFALVMMVIILGYLIVISVKKVDQINK